MAERPTHRRDFLRGASVAEAAQAFGDRFATADPSAAARPPALRTLTRKAMACDFQVQLHATSEQNETEAALEALDVIERVEDRLTVYRRESGLMDLNHAAAAGPAVVAEDLFELLALADTLHADSGGAFDVTGGPLSRVWGFSQREGRMPSDDERREALSRVGWDKVAFNREDRTLAFRRAGMGVDFNSFGKGYALDLAAARLTALGVEDCLLHGGRSTLVARGRAASGGGWGIGVRHPLRPQRRLAECRLHDAAFSTSGSATQCFVHGGKRYGHLIDPRTGWPAEGLHSVSVVAPTGAEADALSTAFFVMGFEAAEAYCRSRPEIQAVFVLPAKTADGVELRPVRLDPDCWRLSPG